MKIGFPTEATERNRVSAVIHQINTHARCLINLFLFPFMHTAGPAVTFRTCVKRDKPEVPTLAVFSLDGHKEHPEGHT